MNPFPVTEAQMELMAHLYSFMTDADKAAWSMDAARDMVDDQHRYEIEHGIPPTVYFARDFYEFIRDLIGTEDKEDAE